MKTTHRFPILLMLPLVFAGAGMLAALMATKAATLITPEPVTLLDAAATGNDEAIFRMVSAGQDPGSPVILERTVFHWRQGDVASPLLAAIAADSTLSEITYLVSQTRRLTESPNDQALCVAARYGRSGVAEFLMETGAPAVPKGGCGEAKWPEEIAKKYGSSGLARQLRQYRIGKVGGATASGE